jgi:N-acyl-D-amino-acid deacylase
MIRACLLAIVLMITFQTKAQYDITVVNGRIVDGTGNPWFYGDVAIKDGKIIKIGKAASWASKYVIDAKGLVVAPGFIDVHTHIEGNDLRVPTAGNFIMDGVTSVVTGNCGGSNVDVAQYFQRLDSVRTSINIATLIGHNSVRRKVMGEVNRDPTMDEQTKMEDVVVKAMQDGAVGLSTGLIYVPGTYSKTLEVIGLAKAAAKYNGVYASHIRDEGDQVNDAIEEAINIGRKANVPVEISHFKVTYKPNWGKSISTIAQVDKARKEGIDVTIDQYPYIASSTTLNTQIPSWALSGGADSLKWRLKDPATRKKIKGEILESMKRKKLTSYSFAFVAYYAKDTTYNGKTISEVNLLRKRTPKLADEAETVMEMVENGSASMIYFSMNEDDLRRIMQYPFNMFASDAGIARFGSGMPHPRGYGTNARVLAEYVRVMKIISLEDAVRRMTSLPAQKFQLGNRGLVREGFAADLVIFDESSVGDVSTFMKPHAYSKGFRTVIVNGQIVAENGKHTGVRSGQVLRGPGYIPGK